MHAPEGLKDEIRLDYWGLSLMDFKGSSEVYVIVYEFLNLMHKPLKTLCLQTFNSTMNYKIKAGNVNPIR
jgi:hypothetical protein